MSTEYIPKTQAIIEVMQRAGTGRAIVEKRMTALEATGAIQFIDDPRDSRKKLITRAHLEVVVRSMVPA
jgi:hypothetical protein